MASSRLAILILEKGSWLVQKIAVFSIFEALELTLDVTFPKLIGFDLFKSGVFCDALSISAVLRRHIRSCH